MFKACDFRAQEGASALAHGRLDRRARGNARRGGTAQRAAFLPTRFVSSIRPVAWILPAALFREVMHSRVCARLLRCHEPAPQIFFLCVEGKPYDLASPKHRVSKNTVTGEVLLG